MNEGGGHQQHADAPLLLSKQWRLREGNWSVVAEPPFFKFFRVKSFPEWKRVNTGGGSVRVAWFMA